MSNFFEAYSLTVDSVYNDFGVGAKYSPVYDRDFFIWDDMISWDENNKPNPCFSVLEAAKMFFARGAWWLRWKYRPESFPNGTFMLNGNPIIAKRTESGSRFYTLADIERMAHSLAEQNAISGEKLAQILTIVLIQASMYGIFDPKKTK